LRAVQAQIDQETAKLVLLGQQVDAAKEQLTLKQAELAQHIADFGRRMRIMYKSGQISGLELIFSAANFTDLMNRVVFFNVIVREDRRQVAELQKERAAIEAMKADLEAKKAEQARVVKQVQDQKAQLQAVRDQRAAREQQIAAIEAQFQRLLDDMEAQRAALQAQIASLIHESFRARSSGKWRWPMDGVITPAGRLATASRSTRTPSSAMKDLPATPPAPTCTSRSTWPGCPSIRSPTCPRHDR